MAPLLSSQVVAFMYTYISAVRPAGLCVSSSTELTSVLMLKTTSVLSGVASVLNNTLSRAHGFASTFEKL